MVQRRLIIDQLSCPNLFNSLSTFEKRGWIAQTEHYCYLKIDDGFIHQAYPFLIEFNTLIHKPDYFDHQEGIGAHISIIYPEEQALLMTENMGQIHEFHIQNLLKIKFDRSYYYVLSVASASLARLREMHHLAPQPTFKGHPIMFHITVGVQFIE